MTSPTTEKHEKEATPQVPPKDDVPPVAESAPKIEKPEGAGPIDTAAVTAPVDQAVEPSADKIDAPKDKEVPAAASSTATKDASAPKEKRRTSLFGTLSGTIKKKGTSNPTSDAENTDGETKKSGPSLPKVFRSKPNKAAEEEKKEEAKTEPAAPADAEKPEAPAKDESAAPLTNGASDAKETAVGDVPASAIQTAPEVKASA